MVRLGQRCEGGNTGAGTSVLREGRRERRKGGMFWFREGILRKDVAPTLSTRLMIGNHGGPCRRGESRVGLSLVGIPGRRPYTSDVMGQADRANEKKGEISSMRGAYFHLNPYATDTQGRGERLAHGRGGEAATTLKQTKRLRGRV
jgi:hypothetical protein